MTISHCPHCNARLEPGTALVNSVEERSDFGDTGEAGTLSRTGRPRLVQVAKCPKCGYSRVSDMSKPVDVSGIVGATLWLAEGHYRSYYVCISESDARTLKALTDAGSLVTVGTRGLLSIVSLSIEKASMSGALVNVWITFQGAS